MITMLKDKKTGAGIMLAIGFANWAILCLLSVIIWIKARNQYKTNGGLSKAQIEARNAAFQAAKDNPDLVKQGIKLGAQTAAQHPELVSEGLKRTV